MFAHEQISIIDPNIIIVYLLQKLKNTKSNFIISFFKFFTKVIRRPSKEAWVGQTEGIIKREA
jgi:hypothetical protein